MTDQGDFEGRLEDRIRAHVMSAGRDFDAYALTRAAAAADRPGHRWAAGVPTALATRPLMLALLGLLVGLLAMGGMVAASRLLGQDPTPDDQAPGTFALTGSLSVARYWHTAVRLADGRVLIIGGFPTVPPDDNEPPAPAAVLPAEIYDPATGIFTALSALTSANQGVSATVLQDGRVLIAGGRSRETSPHPRCMTSCRLSGTALDTAVLFDPATNTTTPAGPLTVPRFGHAAVLLQDGRVLLVGGRTGSVPDLGVTTLPEELASSELYDPISNTFSPTGSMAVGVAPDMQFRDRIAITLLLDGRVVVGKEIFDPATGGFHSQVADDSFPEAPEVRYLDDSGRLVRFDPQFAEVTDGDAQPVIWGPDDAGRGVIATLLEDGRVLWTGGLTDPAADAWIGDPLTHGSEPTGPLAEPRLGHTATLMDDGRVLLVGGWTAGVPETGTSTYTLAASLASAELYLPPPRSRLLEEVR